MTRGYGTSDGHDTSGQGLGGRGSGGHDGIRRRSRGQGRGSCGHSQLQLRDEDGEMIDSFFDTKAAETPSLSTLPPATGIPSIATALPVVQNAYSDSTTQANDTHSSSSSSSNLPLKKVYVWVEDDELLPSEVATHIIGKSFKKRLDKEGFTWKKVKDSTKDLYFEEFRKYAYWDPGYDDAIREAWNPRAGKRYSDFLYETRTKKKKKHMPEPILKSWQDYWNTNEFKIASQRGSKNRGSGEGGPSKHCGGSVSFRTPRIRMEAKKGVEVSAPKFFLATHKEGTNELITPKAQRIDDDLEKKVADAGPSQTEEEDLEKKNRIYLEVVGQSHGRRVYGTDSSLLGDAWRGKSTARSTARYRASHDEMQKKLAEMEAREREREIELEQLRQENKKHE